jgi:uncharacterized protein (DUF433 family)
VPLRVDEYGEIRVGETRVSLASILYDFRNGTSAEEIHRNFPSVQLSQVYVICGYYLDHRAEVDAHLVWHEAEADRVRAEIERIWPPAPGLRAKLEARLAKNAAPRS